MKKIILDTHTFIWWVENAPQLSKPAVKLLEDINNECYISLVSCWEMAIKSRTGKLQLTCPVTEYIPQHMALNRFKELPITFRHISRVETLPFHHRDPFDRLLIAQALEEKATIVSADIIFDNYKVTRIW